MSRRLERWRARVRADRTQLLVCRGGDCGSRRKHPEVDHRAQLIRSIAHAPDGVDVRATRCLDACEHSNVFVIVPSRAARDAGAEPAWVGRVLDGETADAVVDAAGGAVDSAGDAVRLHRFMPGLRSRRHVLP